MERTFDVQLSIGFANATRKYVIELDDCEELDDSDINEIIWDRIQEFIEFSWKERT